MAVPADVTDRAAVAAAAHTIEVAWGGIDLAIFNAGGSVGDRTRFRGDDCAAGRGHADLVDADHPDEPVVPEPALMAKGGDDRSHRRLA